MRRDFVRIGVLLAAAMLVVFVAWEVVERSALGETSWTGRDTLHLVRGTSSAAILSFFAAWLISRWHRRNEEMLLRQSQENRRMRQFFENIVEDAGEAIISLDGQGRILSWNGAAEAIYGYRADEMIGNGIGRLLPPDLAASGEVGALAERVAREGFVRDYETRRRRKDGEIRSVRITRSALRDGEGRIVGSTAIVRDITAEQQMKARLMATQKLAAVGQSAAGIAHEVRNALAGISGAIQVLKRNAAWRELPPGFGEEVDFQVARIARIVADFLEYAHPGELRLQPADLHKIMEHALVQGCGSNGTPRIERDYQAGDVAVEVDPGWLEQAIAHLVANAIQAMGADGNLTVSTRFSNGTIVLRIADNGCGMSGEALARAFEPFFTTKVRGTGMGLPIVQTVVEAHRGTVTLESLPGHGTAVTIHLPASLRSERIAAENLRSSTGGARAAATG